MENGFILECLIKHFSDLHKPCWSLISLFDPAEAQRVQELEKSHWDPKLVEAQLTKVGRAAGAAAIVLVSGSCMPAAEGGC